MQSRVRESLNRCHCLWDRDQILLKIAEELGELIQAFRKKGLEEQRYEFGDVLFSVLALAERESLDSENLLNEAILRCEKYCLTKSNNLEHTYCRCCSNKLDDNSQFGLCYECHQIRHALAGVIIDERGID